MKNVVKLVENVSNLHCNATLDEAIIRVESKSVKAEQKMGIDSTFVLVSDVKKILNELKQG